MAKYYYLISSLPMLKANEPLPFSYEEFLSKCKEQMSKKDFEEIKRTSLNNAKGAKSSLMKKWEDYISKVNSILKEERLKKLGWNEESTIKSDFDSSLRERIHKAVYKMNPLDAEIEILNIYFDFLSSREGFDPFNTENLMIYAIKLQIMERMNSFDQEEGKEEFEKLFSSIQAQFN